LSAECRLGAESGGSALPDTGRSRLTAVDSRHQAATENRLPRCESGFCHFHPIFRGYGLTAARANSEDGPLTPTQLSPARVSIGNC
jgi:hypothetical protein